MNYYNEWDPQAAAWLRELISERLIPRGLVDERSITEVKAEDLEGFTQCHFFAGIGGWPLALQLAGVDHRTPLWTGSPPCQPFSAAGKQLGQFDPRHLAPVFLDLISQCRPPVLFGEQVAPAIAKSWMCDLQAHLEGEDYAVGFAVLPACSVGAPHKRERLFFGAHNLAESLRTERNCERLHGLGKSNKAQGDRKTAELTGCGDIGRVGDTDSERLQREWRNGNQERREGQNFRQTGLPDGTGPENYTANPRNSFWSDADWLGCRDGKFRPVEPGTFPLANGVPARVGRLRGYGNAIVPEVAAEFVRAFLAAFEDATKG
ncbi:DNA cytosine methyltransferase [Salmonella enterica]|uniref:DNA (cytosine-5-)-methyltransferase n=1 Tax=Salmonella enterica subsp. enterica serovar Newport str. CFSAN000835 TaxID=1299174 RepID=A0A658IDF5_SALNE|nr:DNA cytosine methyltransferase [Salmonella enterica]EIG0184776.1 DNA cytosine methyltransferase [Salmonella enterica]PXV46906.1 DNA cytosine methyltransferase [Salmonella enterica subsp. enterica serovar Newport str. CFSAN000834]RIQ23776.1 DNA cytosine methyltransferase [Salmonella enterica subsp. enterica serovar Newport str. CFSAN000835]